jgi:hypothetical protein
VVMRHAPQWSFMLSSMAVAGSGCGAGRVSQVFCASHALNK